MNKQILNYLSMIGRRGGKKSRRTLDSKTAKEMVKVRELKRLFNRYYTTIFWHVDPTYEISLADLGWISESLIKSEDKNLKSLGRSLLKK